MQGFFSGAFPAQPVVLEGSQHSSHAPWSPGTAPAALRKPWNSSSLPQGSPAQLSLPLGQHWQSCPCPGRVLAEDPLPYGALAQFPLPWGALAQLSLPLEESWQAPSSLGEHWHSCFYPKRAQTQLSLPSGGVLAQLALPLGESWHICPCPMEPWHSCVHSREAPAWIPQLLGEPWHCSYTPGRPCCRASQHLAKPLWLPAVCEGFSPLSWRRAVALGKPFLRKLEQGWQLRSAVRESLCLPSRELPSAATTSH